MKFIAEDRQLNDERVFTLTLYGNDFMNVFLSGFDNALLAECEKSNKVSDKLLALEMLVRKMEEGDEKAKTLSDFAKKIPPPILTNPQ